MSGQRQHGKRQNRTSDRADKDPNWSRQPRSKLADPSVNSMPAASSSPAQQPSLTPHEECVAYFRREWQQFSHELDMARKEDPNAKIERYIKKGTEKLTGFRPFDIDGYLANRKSDVS
ncbi:uncharacterized protein LOC134184636 isoform X2 [Corticium candelabrum]|uniref:uncharacterized protein LOC134184636 isoform X2 n=1 Tax=Corticium candelabrum TaxID=121492 RepID=UPI002E347D09|nr:uncharacterized protein LOC134184636 isoform X2 [Corticium candelabrum]